MLNGEKIFIYISLLINNIWLVLNWNKLYIKCFIERYLRFFGVINVGLCCFIVYKSLLSIFVFVNYV